MLNMWLTFATKYMYNDFFMTCYNDIGMDVYVYTFLEVNSDCSRGRLMFVPRGCQRSLLFLNKTCKK
jgi:hypothetical protein